MPNSGSVDSGSPVPAPCGDLRRHIVSATPRQIHCPWPKGGGCLFLGIAVPAAYIPEAIIKRMEAREAAGNAREESLQIAPELAWTMKGYEKQPVHGLRSRPVGWEEIVPRIVVEGGVAGCLTGGRQAKTRPEREQTGTRDAGPIGLE